MSDHKQFQTPEDSQETKRLDFAEFDSKSKSTEGSKGFISELMHSISHSFIQAPIDGVKQILDTTALKDKLPKLEFISHSRQLSQEETYSSSWFAQNLGAAIGMIPSFALATKIVRAPLHMLAKLPQAETLGIGQSRAFYTNAALAPGSKAMSITEASLAGAFYDGILKKSEFDQSEIESGKASLLDARLKQSAVGAATFAALSSSSIGLRSWLETKPIQAQIYKQPILTNSIIGALSGIPAGFANVNATAWTEGKLYASFDEKMAESIVSMVTIGGLLPPIHQAASKVVDKINLQREKGIPAHRYAQELNVNPKQEPTLFQHLIQNSDYRIQVSPRVSFPHVDHKNKMIYAPAISDNFNFIPKTDKAKLAEELAHASWLKGWQRGELDKSTSDSMNLKLADDPQLNAYLYKRAKGELYAQEQAALVEKQAANGFAQAKDPAQVRVRDLLQSSASSSENVQAILNSVSSSGRTYREVFTEDYQSLGPNKLAFKDYSAKAETNYKATEFYGQIQSQIDAQFAYGHSVNFDPILYQKILDKYIDNINASELGIKEAQALLESKPALVNELMLASVYGIEAFERGQFTNWSNINTKNAYAFLRTYLEAKEAGFEPQGFTKWLEKNNNLKPEELYAVMQNWYWLSPRIRELPAEQLVQQIAYAKELEARFAPAGFKPKDPRMSIMDNNVRSLIKIGAGVHMELEQLYDRARSIEPILNMTKVEMDHLLSVPLELIPQTLEHIALGLQVNKRLNAIEAAELGKAPFWHRLAAAKLLENESDALSLREASEYVSLSSGRSESRLSNAPEPRPWQKRLQKFIEKGEDAIWQEDRISTDLIAAQYYTGLSNEQISRLQHVARVMDNEPRSYGTVPFLRKLASVDVPEFLRLEKELSTLSVKNSELAAPRIWMIAGREWKTFLDRYMDSTLPAHEKDFGWLPNKYETLNPSDGFSHWLLQNKGESKSVKLAVARLWPFISESLKDLTPQEIYRRIGLIGKAVDNPWNTDSSSRSDIAHFFGEIAEPKKQTNIGDNPMNRIVFSISDKEFRPLPETINRTFSEDGVGGYAKAVTFMVENGYADLSTKQHKLLAAALVDNPGLKSEIARGSRYTREDVIAAIPAWEIYPGFSLEVAKEVAASKSFAEKLAYKEAWKDYVGLVYSQKRKQEYLHLNPEQYFREHLASYKSWSREEKLRLAKNTWEKVNLMHSRLPELDRLLLTHYFDSTPNRVDLNSALKELSTAGYIDASKYLFASKVESQEARTKWETNLRALSDDFLDIRSKVSRALGQTEVPFEVQGALRAALTFGGNAKKWFEDTSKIGISAHDASEFLPIRVGDSQKGLDSWLFSWLSEEVRKVEQIKGDLTRGIFEKAQEAKVEKTELNDDDKALISRRVKERVAADLADVSIIANRWHEIEESKRHLRTKSLVNHLLLKGYPEHVVSLTPELALEAGKAGRDARGVMYDQNVFLSSQNTPKPFPYEKVWETENLMAYFVPVSNPGGLYLGRSGKSNCCQAPGKVGEKAAFFGQESPNGGFFEVVEKENKNNTVAQSVAWLSNDGGMGFDSIETKGFFVDKKHDYGKETAQIYKMAADDLTKDTFHTVVVGEGMHAGVKFSQDHWKGFTEGKLVPEESPGYTDAQKQIIISSNPQLAKKQPNTPKIYVRAMRESDRKEMPRLLDSLDTLEQDKALSRKMPNQGIVLSDTKGGVAGIAELNIGDAKTKHTLGDIEVAPAYVKDHQELLHKAVLDRILLVGGKWEAKANESTTYKLLREWQEKGLIQFEEEPTLISSNRDKKYFSVKFMVPEKASKK